MKSPTASLVTILFLMLVAAIEPAFAQNLALVTPAELSNYKQNWTVIDGRPRSEWIKGHIPGARLFFWEEYTYTDAKGVPYRLRSPKELAEALGRMGVDENTPVVLYGDADKSYGGEGWACWHLSWLGHKGPIRLLSGGIQSWVAQGFPIETGPERRAGKPVNYRFALRPELDLQTSELAENGTSRVLIDTRSTMEWVFGHIPGAVHIPWDSFYSKGDHRPLDVGSLRKLLKAHGIDPSRPVAYYCAAGIRSGYAWTVHELSGLPRAKNYVGGFEEWKRHSLQ